MRTQSHYEKMLDDNPNASIGLGLAAQAVYATKHGSYDQNSPDHDGAAYRAIALDLKSRYGENLSVEQVRSEMAAVRSKEAK